MHVCINQSVSCIKHIFIDNKYNTNLINVQRRPTTINVQSNEKARATTHTGGGHDDETTTHEERDDGST